MRTNRERGFTLIELLVVIAIIGILSAVVLASLNTARAKGRDAARQTAVHNIQVALELYYAVNGRYPSSGVAWTYSNDPTWTTLASALQPYISKLSQDPAQSASGGPETGSYAYAYYSRYFGCDQQWYMLVWRPEASTVSSPGVTACDGTPFNSGVNIGGTGVVVVGVGK